MKQKELEDMKKDSAYEEIGEIKKDLIKIFASELHSKGVNDLDAKECGEVADMIKDLAEAEKACMEACYYETVVAAMKANVEDDWGGNERMGYNTRRYANGRYAPKGRGTKRMGYMPYMDTDDPYYDSYVHDPMLLMKEKMNERFGYPEEDDSDQDPYQSMEYNKYKRAKRHYSETKSPEDKRKMDEHAMKHINQAMDSFREMWRDADPNMRKRMKADLTTLVGEMPT